MTASRRSLSVLSIDEGPNVVPGPPSVPASAPFVPKIRWKVSVFVFAAGIGCGAALCVLTLWLIAELTGR